MSKKIKVLFTSTLNRIAASVRCVSSIIVVLNDCSIGCGACKQKLTAGNEWTRRQWPFSRGRTMHESITIFNDLCKSIETHIYARKKHPLTNYLAKHQKHSKFAVTDIREKPVDSFKDSARASVFAPAIILLTWVSLQNPLRKLLQRSPS